jgi:hypothetical protein
MRTKLINEILDESFAREENWSSVEYSQFNEYGRVHDRAITYGCGL